MPMNCEGKYGHLFMQKLILPSTHSSPGGDGLLCQVRPAHPLGGRHQYARRVPDEHLLVVQAQPGTDPLQSKEPGGETPSARPSRRSWASTALTLTTPTTWAGR